MRDFFNDQFSWASIVLTACLGGISNFDISNWGGPVDGLVLQVKSLLFDWLNFCESVYTPVLILTWVMSLIVLALRILTAIGDHKEASRSWQNSLWILKPVHAIVSSLTLLLLPFAGYAIPVAMSIDALAGVITLFSAIAIIASIPVDRFNSITRVRIIASFIAISVPFLTSLVAGIGASRGVIIAMLIVSAILLPLCNTFVLWKLFFAGADTRTKAWKHGLVWTFSLRAASMMCGVIFLSMLFFDLNSTASGFAYTFWFLWIALPAFQLLPLIIGAKYSNIVPRNYRASALYRPINEGETLPLRSNGPPSAAASLNSLGNMDKAMSEVATA